MLSDTVLGAAGKEQHLELEGFHHIRNLLLTSLHAADKPVGVVAAFFVAVFQCEVHLHVGSGLDSL